MSLNFTQICDKIDRACGTTSTSYTTAQKATDVNIALDDIFSIALKARGWNVDDFNHSKDPFISTNLVSGTKNYNFSRDEDSNLILAVNRVLVADSTGNFNEIEPVDMYSSEWTGYFFGTQIGSGTPIRYGKTGNGIYLSPTPNYNYASGLKVLIDREASYFVYTDTTKVSGIDGLCHDYLYLKPAYEYCRDKGLQNAERLYRDLQDSIKKIYQRYGNKEKDTIHKLIPNVEDCK
jgi:hypothetical protein